MLWLGLQLMLWAVCQAKAPQIHFQPEEYSTGTQRTTVHIGALGTYQLQHRFGAWGELLHDLAARRGLPAHAIALLDDDGAEHTGLQELDHGDRLWARAAPNTAGGLPERDRSVVLTVDAGLGHSTELTVRLSERAVEVARRVCAWQDVCHLRKVRLQQVEAMCRRALQRASNLGAESAVVRLFDLEQLLGSAPDGWHHNITHMQQCLSCEMENQTHSQSGQELAALQLLLDDYAVHSRPGLVRRFMSAKKHPAPVLVRDRPWEDLAFGRYPSVLHNGSHFQMWYRAWFDGVAYAHSTDGVLWSKPALGVVDLDQTLLDPGGSGYIDPSKAAVQLLWKEEKMAAEAGHSFSTNHTKFPKGMRGGRNNVISTPTQGYLGHQAAVIMRDLHETNPEWLYKALHECQMHTCMSVSRDGLHWKPWRTPNTPLTGRAADTYSQLVWDGSKYLLHTRTDFGTDGGWREIRGHRTEGSTSGRLTPQESNFQVLREWYLDKQGKGERTRRHIYSVTSTLYAGVHLGFLGVIQHPRDFQEGGINFQKRHERDARDVYLGVSRDGVNWDLSSVYAGEPLVERGSDGAWDKDQIMAAPSLVTHQGKHWVYYLGQNERHDCDSPDKRKGIGVGTLEQDRLAGLCVEQRQGTLRTNLFTLRASQITMNIKLGEGATVKAGLQRNHVWLPGFGLDDSVVVAGPLDDSAAVVSWRGAEGLPHGPETRMILELSGDACIFAFRLEGH